MVEDEDKEEDASPLPNALLPYMTIGAAASLAGPNSSPVILKISPPEVEPPAVPLPATNVTDGARYETEDVKAALDAFPTAAQNFRSRPTPGFDVQVICVCATAIEHDAAAYLPLIPP